MVGEEIFMLNNIDPEDISDVLLKVEKSFNIKFVDNDLKDVRTFGELCDVVVGKIQLKDSNDCTTQQAFYKLRNALSKAAFINKAEINLNTDLNVVFPKNVRRQKVIEVEKELGFPLQLLRPKHFYTGFYAILFCISLLGLFVSLMFAIVGMIASLVGTSIVYKFGKELKLKSIGDLAEKMSRESYMNSRRNKETVNRFEVVRKIEQLFSHDLGLELHILTREATFN